jgi:hypothetical protein
VRPPFIGDDRLQMLELASEPLLAIVAEGHSLADTKSVPSARLAQETWLEADVVTDPVFARYWYFRELRTSSPSVPISAGTLEEWLAEIAFGRGVNVVPAGLAEEYRRPGLAFVPVADADAPESRLVLAWRRDNAPPSGNDPGRVRSPTAQRGCLMTTKTSQRQIRMFVGRFAARSPLASASSTSVGWAPREVIWCDEVAAPAQRLWPVRRRGFVAVVPVCSHTDQPHSRRTR